MNYRELSSAILLISEKLLLIEDSEVDVVGVYCPLAYVLHNTIVI